MDTLLQDLRHGLRTFRRSPVFTLVVVLTLALGIGANTAIFSVVNGVLLRDLPYPESRRLVEIFTSAQDAPRQTVSGPDFLDLKAETQALEQVAARRAETFTLMNEGDPERIEGQIVTARFFDVLGASAAVGRLLGAADTGSAAGRVVVLSHGLWQRRFGSNPDVVGQSLALNDQLYTVVGVLRAGAAYPETAELWALAEGAVPKSPFSAEPNLEQNRLVRFLNVIARLKPGVSATQAQSELAVLSQRLEREYPHSNQGGRFTAVPLAEVLVGDHRRPLFILLGAVGLVLLIACGNGANLLLTRAAIRRHELGLRTALGAGRARLVRQLLTESLLLALVGGTAGLILAGWWLPPLLALVPEHIPRLGDVAVDGRVLIFSLALSCLTGLLFGLVPALQASRTDVSRTINEVGRGRPTAGVGTRVGSLLVASQVALSIVLLVAAGLLIKSFWRLQQADSGFQTARVVTVSLPLPQPKYTDGAKQSGFYQQLLDRVDSLSGVEAAAAVFPLPFSGDAASANVVVEGRITSTGLSLPKANLTWVTPEYLRTAGLALLRGRDFTAGDTEDAPRVIIINQSMARRFWPTGNALGKRLKLGGASSEFPWHSVVGLVGDTRPQQLDAEPQPEIYLPLLQNPWPGMTLMVRTAADPASVVSGVRREVAKLDAGLPLGEVRTFEQLLSQSVAHPQFRTLLLSLFAAIALVLAAVGIYGVISYGVVQRTHELGIRKALGATSGGILRLVIRQGMVVVALGTVVGLVAAIGAGRLLSGLLFGVSATDGVIFLAVPLLLVAVALLAVCLPARRATRVDPVVALRSE